MGVRQWWTQWQEARMHAYLTAHQAEAVGVLRRHPEIGVAAAQAAMVELMQAATGGRRSTPYPVLSQLGLGARYPLTTTLPKVTPFNLRRFSEYPPARRAINAICNPIVELPWSIELTPDPHEPKREPTVEEELQMEAARRTLQEPNGDDSWRTLLEAVLEDVIIGGYGAIEMVETDDLLKPLDLYPVDGQSIRINAAWHGQADVPRYTQALAYGGLTVGTADAVPLYDDELIYLKLNPRTHTPFGLGYLEVAFMVVNAWLGAFEYAERRASNATPNFALFLGEDVDLPTVRQWQSYWEEQIEGTGKVPILGGGKAPSVLSMIGTGEDQLYLKWQEWLVRVIAVAFGLSPLTVGIERDVNRSTAETQNTADWDAIRPVISTVEDYLTRRLLWRKFGARTLRFAFLVRDTDELRQAQILHEQWEMDAITVDEVREVYEREPLADGTGGLTKTPFTARAGAVGIPGLAELGGPPQLDEEGRWTEAPVPVPVGEDEDEATEREAQGWLTRAQAVLAAAAETETPPRQLRLVAG